MPSEDANQIMIEYDRFVSPVSLSSFFFSARTHIHTQSYTAHPAEESGRPSRPCVMINGTPELSRSDKGVRGSLPGLLAFTVVHRIEFLDLGGPSHQGLASI